MEEKKDDLNELLKEIIFFEKKYFEEILKD
jgi:hypothetical protein